MAAAFNPQKKFSVKTMGRPVTLKMTVETSKPCNVYFRGDDITQPNSTYFSRRRTIYGKDTLEFPMPISPELLGVGVECDAGATISITNTSLVPLKTDTIWVDDYVKDFVKFISNICQNAGVMTTGTYMSDNNEFVLMYMDKIDGVTPARVNRTSGLMKVAKDQFVQFTIPMRMFIMLHELCHHYIPTKSEKKADSCAIYYYLKFGFPQTEANYAMTKVFGSDHPEAVSRVKHLNRNILVFNYTDKSTW